MRHRELTLIGLIAAMTSTPAAAQPIVRTADGPVAGTATDDVDSYRGIPYAAPPVGDLRWRAPRPVEPWTAVRDATRFGSVCVQPAAPGDAGVGREAPSEDCLTLNVWSPAGAARPLPVMVWLHGGGYVTGSASAPLYDGAALARRGVVVVTLNYRLGHFGFFAHPGLTAGEGPNFGLLDQLAALRWVRGNIAHFGGDPRAVTVFGNSAGGESILFLMAMRQAQGSFQRAIVQSGLGGRRLLTAAQAVDPERGRRPIAELRALDAGAVLAWGKPSLYRGFGPVIDGATVTGDLDATFAAGTEADVLLIIGFNSLEFPIALMGGAAVLPTFVQQSPAERTAWIAAYGSAATYIDRVASDVLFRAPAYRLARQHAAHGRKTWLYEFDASPPPASKLAGAPHAAERAYVFGTLGHAPWPADADDRMLSAEMVARWTAFAKFGRPSAPQAFAWPLVPTGPGTAGLRLGGARGGSLDPLPPASADLFFAAAP